MNKTYLNNKKIAIVYDWLDKWGGVERVLLTLHEIFPHAEFLSSYYDKKAAAWAKDFAIKTSFIQKLPNFIKNNRLLSLPFYPLAFESFDLTPYDLVISVSSSFAKSVITKPSTLHVCYLLTPTRYLWVYPEEYRKSFLKKIFFNLYAAHLKKWDFIASKRPDYYISISKTVKKRLKKYYQQDSQLIYPPFDIKYWRKIQNLIPTKLGENENFKLKNLGKQEYFLIVSRLEQYKKINLVIKVFNKLKENLLIVGKGTELNELKKIAKQNIFFLQDLTDEELAYLYQNAKALIMPQEEDFGYTSLEAQFFNCPVIAYKKGGATETIIEDKGGIFFEKQTEKDLIKALEKFHTMSYTLKNNALKYGAINVEQFAKDIFKIRFTDYINFAFNL